LKMQKPARRRKKAPREYQKHGLYAARRALMEYGSRAIDGRSTVGRELAAWRRSYITDLGGDDAIGTAQRTLVERASMTHMLICSIDAWIAAQPTIVSRRKRALYPIILQRQSLLDSLARLLSMLGLERKPKPIQSLQEYLSSKENQG